MKAITISIMIAIDLVQAIAIPIIIISISLIKVEHASFNIGRIAAFNHHILIIVD